MYRAQRQDQCVITKPQRNQGRQQIQGLTGAPSAPESQQHEQDLQGCDNPDQGGTGKKQHVSHGWNLFFILCRSVLTRPASSLIQNGRVTFSSGQSPCPVLPGW